MTIQAAFSRFCPSWLWSQPPPQDAFLKLMKRLSERKGQPSAEVLARIDFSLPEEQLKKQLHTALQDRHLFFALLEQGDTAVIDYVFEWVRPNLATVDGSGNGVLHDYFLGLEPGLSHGVLEKLVQRGAGVTQVNRAGITPLHLALLAGDDEGARLLVEKGADIYAKSQGGWTPLQLATSLCSGPNKAIEYLSSRSVSEHPVSNRIAGVLTAAWQRPLLFGSKAAQGMRAMRLGVSAFFTKVNKFIPTNRGLLKGLESWNQAANHLTIPLAALTLTGTYSMVEGNREGHADRVMHLECEIAQVAGQVRRSQSDAEREAYLIEHRHLVEKRNMEFVLKEHDVRYDRGVIAGRYLGLAIPVVDQIELWVPETLLASVMTVACKTFTGLYAGLNILQSAMAYNALGVKDEYLRSTREILAKSKRFEKKIEVIDEERGRLANTRLAHLIAGVGYVSSLVLLGVGLAAEITPSWHAERVVFYSLAGMVSAVSGLLPIVAENGPILASRRKR